MNDSFSYEDSGKDALISVLISNAVNSISRVFKRKTNKSKKFDFEESLLSNHFNELYNWCKELEFIGLSGKPISTIIKTIQLNYKYSHNRKSFEDETVSSIKEDDFVFINGNVIIEGDPGSGKTTTLKRLLYKFFFDRTIENIFNYPILVRFRSIDIGFDLYRHICNLIGINYDTRIEEYEEEVIKIKMVKTNGVQKEKRYTKKEIKTRPVYFVNDQRIEPFLINLLEDNQVLLIMDGLDELKPELFGFIQKEIKEIGMKLSKSKIIITSRPNYVKTAYTNFSIYQVKALSTPQIKSISKLWLPNYDKFIEELEPKSYFELANRPLFLGFLVLLYIENLREKEKTLPKSSKEVYEQIIELLIIKWDKERDIKRKSKYAHFDEKSKVKFLAHLSFRLTYIIKAKIFDHSQLIQAYISICPNFELPADEAELVAEEIENHTGIIIKSMYNKYEFSHLAIQEYLCALYIIGAPFNEKIDKYLIEYSPPLALAIALSTDSSLWLSELIIRILNTINDQDARTQISAQILYRLSIESPYFEKKPELGVALMSLCKFCNCKNTNFAISFDKLLAENPNIEDSILYVLRDYSPISKNSNFGRVTFKKRFVHGTSFPDLLCLPGSSNLVVKNDWWV